MSARKALVEIGGTIQELPTGDILTVAEGQFNKVSEQEPLFVTDLSNSSDPQEAKAVFLTGQPGGDFEGVNLLEEAFKGQLQLPVNTPDIKKDQTGGILLSDGVTFVKEFRTSGTIDGGGDSLVVDTSGYASALIVVTGGGGTYFPVVSDNLSSKWVSVQGFDPSLVGQQMQNSVATTSGGRGLVVPTYGKYLRVYGTSVSGICRVSITLKKDSVISSSNVIAYVQQVFSCGLAAGSLLVGDVGIQYRTNNTGAASTYKFTSAATTNAVSIKSSAGRVIGWQFTNTTAALKFVRLFNKASAPTVGTDSPVIVIGVPANGSVNHSQDGGIGFATGIAFACTGAVADLDATVTAANDVLGSVFYA